MKKTHGFTIVEIVIVLAIIAILATLITPLAVNQITQKRYDVCREELTIIKKAIIGNPSLVENGIRSSFGFIGDLGIIPSTLEQLVSQGTFNNWQPAGSIFYGWNGPYINEYLDPWRSSYNYVTTGLPSNIIVRIWSNGKNRINDSSSGNSISGDDSYIDIHRDEAFSLVTGNTFDACGAGTAFTGITVSYPSGNTILLSTPQTTTSIDPIFFINTYIPIGIRVISVQNPTQTKLLYINNGPVTAINLKIPGPCN